MKAKKIINIWKPIKNDKPMKTIKILILILTIFIASETKAQYFSDTIHIIPQFPTINDTIFLVNIFVNPNGGSSLDSSFINYYQSDIFVDFFYAAYITYFPAIDTINIGTLPAGDYELFLNMYLCASIGCVSWDTLYRNLEFAVSQGAGFFENDINEEPINIFPNPCSKQLHLRFQKPAHDALSLELISHTGKIVYRDNISNIESYSLNTSYLASGMYLLRLTGMQQTQTFKIIVAH